MTKLKNSNDSRATSARSANGCCVSALLSSNHLENRQFVLKLAFMCNHKFSKFFHYFSWNYFLLSIFGKVLPRFGQKCLQSSSALRKAPVVVYVVVVVVVVDVVFVRF